MWLMGMIWKELFDSGVLYQSGYPAGPVPENSCRIRISMMATHTDEQIDFVLDVFARIRPHIQVEKVAV